MKWFLSEVLIGADRQIAARTHAAYGHRIGLIFSSIAPRCRSRASRAGRHRARVRSPRSHLTRDGELALFRKAGICAGSRSHDSDPKKTAKLVMWGLHFCKCMLRLTRQRDKISAPTRLSGRNRSTSSSAAARVSHHGPSGRDAPVVGLASSDPPRTA